MSDYYRIEFRNFNVDDEFISKLVESNVRVTDLDYSEHAYFICETRRWPEKLVDVVGKYDLQDGQDYFVTSSINRWDERGFPEGKETIGEWRERRIKELKESYESDFAAWQERTDKELEEAMKQLNFQKQGKNN